ncbi:four helix bundle protein [Flavobacterium sp.]|uniref:four helix bundle protein n=1 Tax=Flavobacterium sp. TaxID=239 RepID=UPI0035276242
MKKFDLNERLIDFAVQLIFTTDSVKNTKAGNHLTSQLIRSGTSPALNYSEAQSAESKNDFIHKMAIVLKELRESLTSLKIIHRANLFASDESQILKVINENNELVSIFVKSIETTKKNKL